MFVSVLCVPIKIGLCTNHVQLFKNEVSTRDTERLTLGPTSISRVYDLGSMYMYVGHEEIHDCLSEGISINVDQ
jgi:hypothetical protein